MQALNLQLLEPQNSKIQPKKISQGNEPKSDAVSFRSMVQSAAKKENKISSEAKNAAGKGNASDSKVAEHKSPNKIGKFIKEEKPTEVIDVELENSESIEIQNARMTELIAQEVPAVSVADQISLQDNYDVKFTVENEVSVENAEPLIGENELSYLKTKAPSNDSIDVLENVQEYNAGEELFIKAQNLSLEEPKKFLDRLEVADENSLASDVDLSAMATLTQVHSPDAQPAAKTEGNDAKQEFFRLEVADEKSGVKKEATSLFNEIFTVTDNRSVEEKVAQFKSMINEQSEVAEDNSINLALTMNENASQNILSSNNQSAGASGSTFQEMLTQQVQTNVPDFVKAGNIVLRDNDQGSINMILKPESLGNVKINLQVSDNVITGQITVHSKEAFEAFKQNMDTLRQAFQDSGFENATLNLSFADNSSSGAFAQGERQQSSEQFFSNKAYGNFAASAESDTFESSSSTYGNEADRQISIVA